MTQQQSLKSVEKEANWEIKSSSQSFLSEV